MLDGNSKNIGSKYQFPIINTKLSKISSQMDSINNNFLSDYILFYITLIEGFINKTHHDHYTTQIQTGTEENKN